MSAAKDKFPSQKHLAASGFFDGYRRALIEAWATVDGKAIERAADLLQACMARDGVIYCCGNGGSAAIANHLLCDFHKGTQTGTSLRPRVVSFSAHLELLTAIANDIAYSETFVYQLRTMARPGDLLIVVSSSGNSENIVRAAQWAKDNSIPVIALTGFTGGKVSAIADTTIYAAANNYGIVEDIHQSVMHVLAQYLRQAAMPEDKVPGSVF